MKILKCSEFLLESLQTDANDALLKMLKDKPLVKMDNLPDEKDIYSIAGMKTYLKDHKGSNIDLSLNKLQNEKELNLQVVRSYNPLWKKKVPYWYINLSKEKAEKIAEDYSKESLEKNKKTIEDEKSKKLSNAKSIAAKKELKKKKTTPTKERKPISLKD